MTQAVIFDMNGVLIDDEDVHELSFKKALEKYNAYFTHHDYLRIFVGKTHRAGVEQYIKEFNRSDIPIKELIDEKEGNYFELFSKNYKTFDGLLELVKHLSLKYRLALTTSSPRDEVDLILKTFELEKYFPIIVTSDDITHGKPDPEPYLLTSEKLNIKPEFCCVIEDSKSGVLSAKAAGMKCIGITTTHIRADLEKADVVVDKFTEISDDLINSL